jgi:hypothetical protein
VSERCELCGSQGCSRIAADETRRFLACGECDLVFVAREDCVGARDERARYELHRNTLDNDEYVRYLRGIADRIGAIPMAAPRVLDFGSGPHQVLAHILAERGVECSSYDPVFDVGADSLGATYDVVVVCEVLEHLRELKNELHRIGKLLNPGGCVVARTELYTAHTDFATWWYARDPTHVNFFRLTTMVRVADELNKAVFVTDGRNVTIFS